MLFAALAGHFPGAARSRLARPGEAPRHRGGGAGAPGPAAVGGFTVKRVYQYGRQTAMDLVDLATGRRSRLVSFGGTTGPAPRPAAFEEVGVPAVLSALASSRVVVMDELGRFELAAPRFQAVVRRALEAPVPVVGVLKAESNPFLDSIRAHPEVRVIMLDPSDPARRAAAAAEFRAALDALLRLG